MTELQALELIDIAQNIRFCVGFMLGFTIVGFICYIVRGK
jgi:hypothetical protein